MKPRIYLGLIGVLIISCVLYFHLHYFRPGSVAESIMIDKTDSFLAKPQTSEIISMLHFREDKWKSANIRIQAVTNFNYNNISSIELPSDISIISNPGERDKDIDYFTLRATSTIDSINKLENTLANSCIYSTLITEVNKMASLREKEKIVIMYSDLFENGPLFRIYDSKSLQLLKTNMRTVKQLFEKYMKPGNLSGMKIYLVFKPLSLTDNARFALMSALYKSILEEAGATVFIGANLIEDKNS